MKIVYFYQYFSTPKGSWGTRVYEFAKQWVEQGHEVTVVSSAFSKSDIVVSRLVEDHYFDGIHVKVINTMVDNRQPFNKRVRSFLAFSILSSYFALTLKADIVIASSGPITAGIPGLVARYLRGRKLVFETRDLWPENAIALGVIKNPFIIKLSYWLERACYRASGYVVTLSPGMTENIVKRFNISHIDHVTNAANITLFSTPAAFKSTFLKPNKYAVYTGNIGMVNNSEWLYNAAKSLKQKGREDLVILLIGEGQQREHFTKKAEQEGINNFIVINLMPKTELVAYVQNALVSLVPLRATPVLDTSSPNKFFESLAAGVPVIQNTQGWIKDFLNQHCAGFTIQSNDGNELADKLIWLDENPEVVKEMGNCASRVAKQHFDKDYLAKKMLNILLEVHGNGKNRRQSVNQV